MIALDVMGGDYAPDEVLSGALAAGRESVKLILVGPEQLIKERLSSQDSGWDSYPITICNSTQQIAMDDEPVAGVCKKKDSSIVKIIELVKSGQASVAISAGNSGAVMVAASLILGKEPGMERPAIAGLLPTLGGNKVLALDLGANTDCKPKHLYQFAELGYKYSKKLIGKTNPRIALLSNGQENSKGSMLTKEVFVMLKNSTFNFVGNIEPCDIYCDKTDIVVCDGFSGNILLKTMESSFESFAGVIKRNIAVNYDLALQIENSAKNIINSSGGALLLGVNGNVVICHGNSNAQVIKNAILTYASFFS